MALLIEESPTRLDRLKVTFVGQRFSIEIHEHQLLNVVAHYYLRRNHDEKTCPVCKKLQKKETHEMP